MPASISQSHQRSAYFVPIRDIYTAEKYCEVVPNAPNPQEVLQTAKELAKTGKGDLMVICSGTEAVIGGATATEIMGETHITPKLAVREPELWTEALKEATNDYIDNGGTRAITRLAIQSQGVHLQTDWTRIKSLTGIKSTLQSFDPNHEPQEREAKIHLPHKVGKGINPNDNVFTYLQGKNKKEFAARLLDICTNNKSLGNDISIQTLQTSPDREGKLETMLLGDGRTPLKGKNLDNILSLVFTGDQGSIALSCGRFNDGYEGSGGSHTTATHLNKVDPSLLNPEKMSEPVSVIAVLDALYLNDVIRGINKASTRGPRETNTPITKGDKEEFTALEEFASHDARTQAKTLVKAYENRFKAKSKKEPDLEMA